MDEEFFKGNSRDSGSQLNLGKFGSRYVYLKDRSLINILKTFASVFQILAIQNKISQNLCTRVCRQVSFLQTETVTIGLGSSRPGRATSKPACWAVWVAAGAHWWTGKSQGDSHDNQMPPKLHSANVELCFLMDSRRRVFSPVPDSCLLKLSSPGFSQLSTLHVSLSAPRGYLKWGPNRLQEKHLTHLL